MKGYSPGHERRRMFRFQHILQERSAGRIREGRRLSMWFPFWINIYDRSVRFSREARLRDTSQKTSPERLKRLFRLDESTDYGGNLGEPPAFTGSGFAHEVKHNFRQKQENWEVSQSHEHVILRERSDRRISSFRSTRSFASLRMTK